MLSNVATDQRSYPVNLNVRMTVELLRILEDRADAWACSLSEAARRCLAEGAAQLEGAIFIEDRPGGCSDS